jgi:beta-galactosidase
VPVTTNFMRFFKPLDYWKWAEREDVVSDDVYQDPVDPEAGMRSAMAGDLMRSLGHGRPWILMEQSSNRVNWRPVNIAKAPGQMRLWSYQAVARGADGVLFFQWRQSRFGAEKFHSAMVPHGPAGSNPTWLDVVRLGRELGELDDVVGSRIRAPVAILHDWESWWALELPSKPTTLLDHVGQLETYYRPLFEGNVVADFARPDDDLSGYRLVLAPNLYLVSDAAAAQLARFVDAGGTLVMSFFSGIVDGFDHIRLGGYPAPFRELLGLRVEDFLPLPEGETADLAFEDQPPGQGSIWSELVTLQGAELLARFSGGRLDGQPAVTSNRFGQGVAYYLATRPDPRSMARLLKDACAVAGVEAVAKVPEGVETVRRAGDGGSFLFLLNHRDADAEVTLREQLIRIGPRDVAVVREGSV